MESRNLVLIGFMGTGKSAVGKACAKRLHWAFRDSDIEVERRAGKTIPAIFAEEGEAGFRQREREAIAALAATPRLVIATGGGAILNPENAERLRETGLVVLLTATPETILTRVGDPQSRPLLANAADLSARVEELLGARQERYLQAAHTTVDTTGLSLPEVVQETLKQFRAATWQTRPRPTRPLG